VCVCLRSLVVQAAAAADAAAEADLASSAMKRSMQQLTAALDDKAAQLEAQSARNQQLTADVAQAAKALDAKQGELAATLADLQVKCFAAAGRAVT